MTPPMLEPQWVSGLATLIAAVTAAAVSVINAWTSARGRKVLNEKVDDAAGKADTAAARAALANGKLDVVSVQTNGHLASLREELIRISAENLALHQTIAALSTALASSYQARQGDRRGSGASVDAVLAAAREADAQSASVP